MKHITLVCSLALLSILLTGCVFIDDNCHYETRCSYITRCETVCDSWGYNCTPSDCYEVVDRCWDEYVCHDDYNY